MIRDIQKNLRKVAVKKKVPDYQRFFKTGKGEYAEGDVFIGCTVPAVRSVAKKYKDASLEVLDALMDSKIHEERMCALFILRMQYERAADDEKSVFVDFYLDNVHGINNWDLVDLSAHYILGHFLRSRDKKVLYDFVKSSNLWERRIAMISTFAFIKYDEFKDALKIAELLVHDDHDLIHKAVGWVLREIGKKDLAVEEKFLKKYHKTMPRTMLRYAIEKFPEKKRKAYM